MLEYFPPKGDDNKGGCMDEVRGEDESLERNCHIYRRGLVWKA